MNKLLEHSRLAQLTMPLRRTSVGSWLDTLKIRQIADGGLPPTNETMDWLPLKGDAHPGGGALTNLGLNFQVKGATKQGLQPSSQQG